MEFTIEYNQVVPYTATVEAESAEEALKQILDNMDSEWPFEDNGEPFVCYAKIESEEGDMTEVECCVEHPYQAIEKLQIEKEEE